MTSTNSNINNEQEVLADPKETERATPPIQSATTPDIPEFGWSKYAERVNGRFAMVGFMAIIIIEVLTHDLFLNWAGFIN